MSFKYILNPVTNRKVSIYGSKGRKILRNYVNLLEQNRIQQSGGGPKNLPIYNDGSTSGYSCNHVSQNTVNTNEGAGNSLEVYPANDVYSQSGGAAADDSTSSSSTASSTDSSTASSTTSSTTSSSTASSSASSSTTSSSQDGGSRGGDRELERLLDRLLNESKRY